MPLTQTQLNAMKFMLRQRSGGDFIYQFTFEMTDEQRLERLREFRQKLHTDMLSSAAADEARASARRAEAAALPEI